MTAEDGYFSDEARDAATDIRMIEPGVPAFQVRKRCNRGRYDIEKTIFADCDRPAVLQRIRFVQRKNEPALRIHALLAPHVENRGHGNDGWADEYKGTPMLFARRGSTVVAFASSAPILAVDCAHAGSEDAWHTLQRDGRLARGRTHALDGNLLLAAELDLSAVNDEALMVLAFGADFHAAGANARAALLQEFDVGLASYVDGWRTVHARARRLPSLETTNQAGAATMYRTSVAVLHTSDDKAQPGGLIASLSTPWGDTHGDTEVGGYHLVWPRDAVECAGALVAAGFNDSARLVLLYLMSTQEADGNWPQNMWLNGRAYWHGVQLDETALPVLLADLLRRHDALGAMDVWPMIRRAAGYLVRNGPATPEDRWEGEGGYSPFTLAVEISALLIAAEFAERHQELELARYLRETADYWNGSIEAWTYCTGDSLARELGIDGYYARRTALAPVDDNSRNIGSRNVVPRNIGRERTHARFAGANVEASEADGNNARPSVLSVDALALVRFGLRRADDARIMNTVRAIDARLETTTRTGPVWHRFVGDTYGESERGIALLSGGIGRGWPLLTGERAHYELARGDSRRAFELRCVMMRQAGECGMIPEQVWDADDIAERHLFNGRPSGSAMPLAWAHAEFIKLCRSIEDGAVFDTPPQTLERYGGTVHSSRFALWRESARIDAAPAGGTLRIESREPGHIEYRIVGAEHIRQCALNDTGLGVYFADLPLDGFDSGTEIRFRIVGREMEPDREHCVRIGK